MAAWTESDLSALEKALATGALRVRYESADEVRDVTYRSQADMQSLLEEMRATLGVASADAAPRSVIAGYVRR